MEQRINFVTLGVRDMARSRAFYHALGWKESSTSKDDFAVFQAGCIAFALYGHDTLAEDAGVPAAGQGFRGVALAYNTRSRDDVAQVLSQAEAAGGRVVKPAQDVFWGGHSGYFADPDGHLWEVAWNPFITLDEQGMFKLPEYEKL